MNELLKLIEENLSLYGRDKYISILSENNDGNTNESEKDEDESVDYLSSCDEDDAEDSDSDECSSDDSTLSDVSEISHDNAVNEMLNLHPPVSYNTIHCPPFNSVESTLYGNCNCSAFAMIDCCHTDNYSFFSELELDIELSKAAETVDDILRVPSNLKRKRLYKLLFLACDFGILETGERRRLPNCAVAKIRQIYPSDSGFYMGYKES